VDTKLSSKSPFIKTLRRLNRRRDTLKRRRPTQIHDDERKDILSLLAAGYDQVSVARVVDRDERTIMRVVAQHRATLREADEAEFKDIYKGAAKIAATKGDHRPALEWLDRMGAIPESSRQRTTILAAKVAAEGQAAVTKHLHAGVAPSPVVNIGFSMPAQLMPAVSETTSGPVTRLLPASENQRLTAIGDEVGEIPSSQPIATVGTVRG
jgi:hypothetical protein